jgi:arylsulfatase A-like enzyme
LLRLTPLVFVHDLLKLRAPVKLTDVLKRRGLLDENRAKAKMSRFVRSVGDDRLLNMHMRMWASSYKQNIQEGHIISLYDFVVRVPLVIRAPAGVPRGRSWNRMVRQPDILPTIMDFVGISPERLGDIDGRSFKPLVEGRPWECLPAYLSLTGLPEDLETRGVRTEQHKYTYGPCNPEMPQELYDLQNDPGETVNLADREPARCSELRRLSESMLPADGQAPAEMLDITADQQQSIERHLQELGYIE